MYDHGQLDLVVTVVDVCFCSLVTDSPGVPPSAGAHQLFRGFSFVASAMLEEEGSEEATQPKPHPVVQVSCQNDSQTGLLAV